MIKNIFYFIFLLVGSIVAGMPNFSFLEGLETTIPGGLVKVYYSISYNIKIKSSTQLVSGAGANWVIKMQKEVFSDQLSYINIVSNANYLSNCTRYLH